MNIGSSMHKKLEWLQLQHHDSIQKNVEYERDKNEVRLDIKVSVKKYVIQFQNWVSQNSLVYVWLHWNVFNATILKTLRSENSNQSAE